MYTQGRPSLAQFSVGEPVNLGPPIETAANELAPELSADGLTLYFQKGNYAENADLYWATRASLDSSWSDPQPITALNTNYHESSPALSPDGRELYFDDGHRSGYPARPKPGGMGGPDIWVSLWNHENNDWGDPVNLGASVNSAARDYNPNLSADGLEMYFSSDRTGGSGQTDVWMTRRATLEDPWSPPVNLGPVINSGSHDERPAISPDGRLLIFASNRAGGTGSFSSLWISLRESVDDDWGQPVLFDSSVNGPYGNLDPDFSSDGTMLYYGRFDSGVGNTLWQVPFRRLELETVPLMGGEYVETFDDVFSIDGLSGESLPTGWAITTNGIFFKDTTTQEFPYPTAKFLPRNTLSVFNAGGDLDYDRSLSVAVSPEIDTPTLQLLTQVEASGALSFQFHFDIEAWHVEPDAATGRSRVLPAEAAFCVSVDIDSGEGFTPLRNLGKVTTGARLSPPVNGPIDGNDEANRISFNSSVFPALIPGGSQLRVRWRAINGTDSRAWVLGLDNVVLSLFDVEVTEPGDFNEDGVLDNTDLQALATQLSSPTPDMRFDLDGNGQVNIIDVTTWNRLSSAVRCWP